MSEKVMDVRFALFNGHSNDAFEKAKSAFLKRFSQEEWNKQIQPHVDAGIMGIFGKKPTYPQQWYVETVGIYVNEGREQ